MKQLKILVVGASGQLGSALMQKWSSSSAPLSSTASPTILGTYCAQKNKNLSQPNSPLIQLDIQNQNQVHTVISQVNPDIIINTAAMTHVDKCEQFPELAESINVKGHAHLAEAAKKIGAKLVFISTYYVFDGTQGQYTEKDLSHPLNTYAKTKVAGEQITLQTPKSLLIRTSKIYSIGYDERNFLARLVAQFKEKKTIAITNDQYTNPVSTEDAATAIALLIAKEATGIYHLGGPDNLSNYDFALTVARKYHFDVRLLQPQSTGQFGAPALRPKRCALDVHKLIKHTSFEPKSIDYNLTLWKNKISE